MKLVVIHLFSVIWLGSAGVECQGNENATTTSGLTTNTKHIPSVGNNRPFIPITPDLNIFLPKGYSKLILPTAKNSSPYIVVSIRFFVHEVVDVDIKNERVKLDADMTVDWVDWKLQNHILNDNSTLAELTQAGIFFKAIDPDFLKHIWTPDVSLHELASVEGSYLLSKKVGLTVYLRRNFTPGHFELRARKTLDLRCDMDFQYYPADTQKCVFNLASYQYYADKLILRWVNDTKWRPMYLNKTEDSNFQFHISDVEPGNLHPAYQLRYNSGITHSALTFTLQIRRNLSYHLIQTYLPSILLVSMTGLSFLLPPDMVEARIGISMTTVLTLTAMFSTIRETSPEVSYTMAIDIWMVFCIFIVFLALVLFADIYWRKLLNLAEGDMETKLTGSKRSNLRSLSRRVTLRLEYEMSKGEGGTTQRRMSKTKKLKYYDRLVRVSRRYSFLAFILVFLTFLAIYSTWLFVCSDYFVWDPNPYYNADEEGGLYKFVFLHPTKEGKWIIKNR